MACSLLEQINFSDNYCRFGVPSVFWEQLGIIFLKKI